jgi:hypothetical protein
VAVDRRGDKLVLGLEVVVDVADRDIGGLGDIGDRRLLDTLPMDLEIKADPRTGVIDMFAGPSKDQMAIFPTRAIQLPDGRTAFSFTMFQGPGMPDELFDSQHESLKREFANTAVVFAG